VRVLWLIAEGNSNKEIAALLSVREDSVKGHVRNILSNLDANDRTHAAMIGVKRGINCSSLESALMKAISGLRLVLAARNLNQLCAVFYPRLRIGYRITGFSSSG
jgi:hypothetical protein